MKRKPGRQSGTKVGPLSVEHKAKISAALKGRAFTDNHKAHLAEAQSRRTDVRGPITDEGRAAIGRAVAVRAAAVRSLKEKAAELFAAMSDEQLATHGLTRERLEVPAGTVVVYDSDGLPLVEWRHA